MIALLLNTNWGKQNPHMAILIGITGDVGVALTILNLFGAL